MMKYLFFISCFLLTLKICAQEQNVKEVDSLYKEDQFYAGVTYNLLGSKPQEVSQPGFSLGFHLGFIKDMPINKRRNVSFGLGLGYSANSFNHNILINRDNNNDVMYSLLDTDTFTKNKFSTHFIEIPFEFRWRNSTASTYNFWRIYTGVKFGYMMTHTVKYKGDLGNFKYSNIEGFNKFQYGLTLTLGYNTWNLHLYYALNPFFTNDAILNGEQLDMNVIKLGLMFYVL